MSKTKKIGILTTSIIIGIGLNSSITNTFAMEVIPKDDSIRKLDSNCNHSECGISKEFRVPKEILMKENKYYTTGDIGNFIKSFDKKYPKAKMNGIKTFEAYKDKVLSENEDFALEDWYTYLEEIEPIKKKKVSSMIYYIVAKEKIKELEDLEKAQETTDISSNDAKFSLLSANSEKNNNVPEEFKLKPTTESDKEGEKLLLNSIEYSRKIQEKLKDENNIDLILSKNQGTDLKAIFDSYANTVNGTINYNGTLINVTKSKFLFSNIEGTITNDGILEFSGQKIDIKEIPGISYDLTKVGKKGNVLE